jgi:hypothetical protein
VSDAELDTVACGQTPEQNQAEENAANKRRHDYILKQYGVDLPY